MKKHFIKSLQEGNKGQKYFTDILDSLNIKWETSNTIHYDIITLEPVITFECKFDMYSSKSGNLAIEFWNSKKNAASGINATTATYWIHILSENEILIAKVVDLRSFCATIKPWKKIESAGDGNASILLYKKIDALQVFQEVNKDNFLKIVSK